MNADERRYKHEKTTRTIIGVLNYLRASVLEVGLLFNFGPKPQVKRLAFSNLRKNA